MTRAIADCVKKDEQFASEVFKAIGRYLAGDFSDMECREDIELNRQAIKSGKDNIVATYNTCKGKVFIVTEWDKSCTTVLFPDEYQGEERKHI